jgi:hypothetical protein
MITTAEYNNPLAIPNSYFIGRVIPLYQDYLTDYHTHFMRYLYYLCIMNAEGEYPDEINIDQIQSVFNTTKEKKCKPRIKKILICEAPPPTSLNYFYNPSPLRWNVISGNPTIGQGWTSAIKNTLFPGMYFPDTVSFLKACAREGFLLLDLFPYATKYSNRNTSRYRQACISAWGDGAVPYLHNIISTLENIKC